MLFQTSLGIDIQDDSISLAYLKASFRDVRLAVHAAYPLEKGIPLKEKVDLIGGMVKEFLEKNSISPASLFFGIPRETAILRYIELPLAVKENLRESLGYEMEKYIPFPADEIYFDYQIVAEDKAAGKLKLLLVAAKKETVDLYLNLAAHIGFGISGIEISSTAVANYFSSQKGSDGTGTCAVVCLRDDRLELDGLKEGFLDCSRSVDRGEWGDDFTGFISRELERQKGGLEDREGCLPTLFCGFDAESECIDYFRTDERLDIRLVDLSRSGLSSPAMIPAYGLALKGIRKQQTDINLVPKERRKRPNKAGYYAMVALAGLLVVLALAWGTGSIISQQLHLKRLNAEIARLGVEVANIEQAKAKCKKIEDRIEYLSGLYGASIPILDVFKELSVRIPKTAWVKQLTFSDHEVIINGFAESSSELIPSLEDSPLFRDVAFRSSITRVGSAGYKEFFRIGLKVAK